MPDWDIYTWMLVIGGLLLCALLILVPVILILVLVFSLRARRRDET